MREKLFWRVMYCTNPRPKTNYQSKSLSHRVLGRWVSRIIREYNIATVIVIRTLNQPHMCKMVSSIFAATSQIQLASMTRYSFTSMPPMERTNRESVYVARGNTYCACTYFISPTKPGAFPLAPSCGYLSLGYPVLCKLWPRSDFNITPEWGCHISSLVLLSPEVPTHLIWWCPGGIGVLHIHSSGKRMIVIGKGYRTYFY